MRNFCLAAVGALLVTPPLSSAIAVEPARPAEITLEAMLAKVFQSIQRNQFDTALAQTDTLLRTYPNFRLGYLIKGDLLTAMSGTQVRSFGSASNAPSERVADLRAEALTRLQAYREKPPTNRIPRYLLQMDADQKYALVVDARRSRLYLYQNDNGRPRFVADYYVTQGKLGTDKIKEGDKRTPIGVYHVTSKLPRERLSDFYGVGAYPISYPNEWDRMHGRDGHGIWLHGTPSDTFSRPPKASDGCVVLANADLARIASTLQIGVTPVIISNDVEWLSLDDWQIERTALKNAMEQWRKDWESRDTERYLSHYSRRFSSSDGNFNAYAARKRQVNAGKEWIKVGLSEVSMFRNPGADEVVVVNFMQKYDSNNLKNEMKKRQYWVREKGVWHIIYEGAA